MENNLQFLTFELGNEIFAFEITRVKEIVEYGNITVVPGVPPFILGVINLRGLILPVIDLRTKFHIEGAPISKTTRIILVETLLEEEISALGIIADRVKEVLDVPDSKVELPPKFGAKIKPEFLKGMIKTENDIVVVLDIDKTLSVSELGIIDDLIETGEEIS